MVSLTGYNDFGPGKVDPHTVTQSVENLLSVDIKTHKIINTNPYRYDELDLNTDICYANQIMIQVLTDFRG